MKLQQYMITTTAMVPDQTVSQGQAQEPQPVMSCSSIFTTKNGSSLHNAQNCNTTVGTGSSRWNQKAQFPWKIHRMLDDAELDDFAHIVSWMPNNQAFRVHDNDLFVELVLPRYFRQTQYKSFQRQLNLWGFERVTTGFNQGGYSHKCFVRGKTDLCKNMKRLKIKGGSKRQAALDCATPIVTRSLFSRKEEGGSPPAPRIVSPASPCHVTQSAPVEKATATAQLPPLPSTRTKPFIDLFDEETLASVLILSPDSKTPMSSSTIQAEESNMFPNQLEGVSGAETFAGMAFFAI